MRTKKEGLSPKSFAPILGICSVTNAIEHKPLSLAFPRAVEEAATSGASRQNDNVYFGGIIQYGTLLNCLHRKIFSSLLIYQLQQNIIITFNLKHEYNV